MGDRHLKFHESRDNLTSAAAGLTLVVALADSASIATQGVTLRSAVDASPIMAGLTGARPASPSVITPITMSAIGEPLVVAGSDGMQHIDYDLLVTNSFTAPVTLTSVDVRDGDRSLLTISGAALQAVTQGNFSREPVDPPAQIPLSGQVAVEIDVKIPAGAKLPRQLDHVISWSLPASAPDLAVFDGATTGQIRGLPLNVSRTRAEVIAAPLKGAGWASLNGCCLPNAHRSLRLAIDGSHQVKPEMFAIDWVQLRNGTLFTGDGSTNADFPYIGSDVLAVADGTVVNVRDGMPNQVHPLQPAQGIEKSQDYSGNSIIIKISPDRYALYAHLDPGSITVKVGDRVKTGDVVGKLGNSGNSTAPHLHFAVADGPTFLTNTSVPFVINKWTLQGTATLPTGSGTIPVTGPAGPQTRTHPLYLSVANFG